MLTPERVPAFISFTPQEEDDNDSIPPRVIFAMCT